MQHWRRPIPRGQGCARPPRGTQTPGQHGQDCANRRTPRLQSGSDAQYIVEKTQGSFMRFRINQQNVDIKTVPQHVYLGVGVSYRQFEHEIVKRRVQLAQAQQTRLRSILKCQAVALQPRMRLWKACVPSCLLHGLDCTGIPGMEAKQIVTLYSSNRPEVRRSHAAC